MTANPPAAADPDHYRHERYAGGARRGPLLEAYYLVKPLMPRRVQLALRRAYAPRQAARAFPAWPAESVLVHAMHQQLLEEARAAGGRAPFVWFWPDGRRYAAIVTHDVEGPKGIELIPRLLDVERRRGVVSSWNFCAEWYDIPHGVFESVRAAGCEIGLHGIKHDGRLFTSRESFERELPKIHRYLREWGAEGFRSPATHRNADWMHELGASYDSSFPDTDPFEPQAGGCCSIWPFFFGDVVELPITLVQDHTLFDILRRDDIAPWREKTRWIAERHGLVNVIVHPDYIDTDRRLEHYEDLLGTMTGHDGVWHALPRDVAAWWRRRRELSVRRTGEDEAEIVGPDPAGATVAWAEDRDGRLGLVF